jgi:DNA excision repair protein ERCC-8
MRIPGKDQKKNQKTSNGRVVKASATTRKNDATQMSTQRQHPGMASSQDRATAHYGTVTALTPTTDGFYLLSAGTDSRVKLWDIESACNTLVNYESTRIRGNKGMEFSVSSDSSLLFFPSANNIQVYDLWTGHLLKSLRGHYDNVNCCVFHPDQELYSGSSDHKILNWCPSSEAPEDEDEENVKPGGPSGARPDEDAWSD